MYSENFISKKLKAFAEKNEWLVSGEYIYGDEQGYLFSGLDGKKQKTFITPVPGITGDQQNELFEVLEKNKGTMKLQEFTITDDFLCIRIKDSSQLSVDDIEFILALLVGTLQDLNIDSVGRCQECGRTGAEKEGFVYDLYCYMHEDCEKVFKEEAEAEDVASGPDAEDEDNEAGLADDEGIASVKTYKKILFTIFGALLGSIPWLLLPFILDAAYDLLGKVTTNTLAYNFVQSLLTCVCAYLVSYFAIVGYRLSKAKMNIKGRWIVGIVSISVIIIVQFLYLLILIAKEPDVAITFKNYILNLSKFTFYINMLLGAVIGTVFTLIAILPFFDSSISSRKSRKSFFSRKKSEDPAFDEEDETEAIAEDESEKPGEETSEEAKPSEDAEKPTGE